MIPGLGEGWLLHCDNRITRRKLFAVVYDPRGRIAFRSRLVGDCMAYLDAEGVTSYTLFSPDAPFHAFVRTFEPQSEY